MLFDDVLADNESLFAKEDILDFTYLPERLPFREGQQEYLAEAIKPIMAGRQGKTLFLHGGPGIGKTSSVKFVFRELTEKTDDVKPVYINCWKKPTTNTVLGQFAKELGLTCSQFKSNEELWGKINEKMSRFKGFVLAFDEIDRAKEQDFLYQVAEHIKNVCILLISNDSSFLKDLDHRIRSRLVLEDLEFPPYTQAEVQDILRERVKAAFAPNVFAPEALGMVIRKTHERNDIRTGLILLREAGRVAESDSSKKVKKEHVEKALSSLVDANPKKQELSEREKMVLDIIAADSGIESGEIVTKLEKASIAMPSSTLRRITQKLEKDGLIRRETSVSKEKGRTMKHFKQ